MPIRSSRRSARPGGSDGKIDRVEFYEHDVMVRAEEDTDADGKLDKWETYDGARLASVAFDTTQQRPRRIAG